MSSSGIAVPSSPLPAERLLGSPGVWLVAAFLLPNLAVRGHALYLAGAGAWAHLALAGLALGTVLGLLRPALVGAALPLFAASFFLYGFHSYRPQSQVFELLVTALALGLLGRSLRADAPPIRSPAFRLFGAYALLATLSLLLLPAGVLEHRLFLEGAEVGRALLGAFPKDPLYPIASVNRLWLLVLFAWLLAMQPDGRALYRRTFRGIAWAAIAAAGLGLLDFAGWLSLDRYNLSNLFYGSRYRRLQSTFGNPSWFACFVACALPFVLLELQRARGRARLALAAVPPVVAAALVLSGARASWLAVALLLALLAAAGIAARRRAVALPAPDAGAWLALLASVVTVAWLAATALTMSTAVPADGGPPERLEGLSRELQYRGLGLSSPRRIAGEYALAIARLNPLLGLGYESFNLHLRVQLEIPGSGVARIVNTAAAADAGDAVFDDSHNSYLQVLTGTGLVGLALWLLLLVAGLRAALRALRHEPSGEALAVLAGLLVFHFYGLFQGMAYIPITFSLYPLLLGYATTLAAGQAPEPRSSRRWLAGALLLTIAGVGYAGDNGFASLKRRFGLSAYLPDEAAVYEGFYRPEVGPGGEFRWMRRRAIVNLPRAAPFRLRFTCEHPDAEREPVVLSWRLNGGDAGQVVFRRPGVVEQRFDPGAPGALRLIVSRTFRPGGPDRRELGIAVSAIRWE